MSHLCWTDGDLEMANQDSESINARIKREMDRETKGMSPKEKEEYIRNFFAQMKTTKKTMTANKGGMAKAAKKMMRGGVAKKKMRGGGMAKMAQKKMMRGGAVKKKMMRGGAVKKK